MSYYDEIAKGYDELHKKEQLQKLAFILQKISYNKNTKILDVGCGTFFTKDYFDCDIIGIEPSKGLIKQSKHKESIINTTAEGMDFLNNTFDIVISLTAIQNFTDVKKGIENIKRVGKQEFYLSVLKKSPKAKEIDKLIRGIFSVKETIIEEKDVIYCVYP